MEVWKDVVGYEGRYEVSNTGDIRNSRTGRVLSPGLSQGYLYVALYRDGSRQNKQINRLVAEAFLDNPNNYPIVNHRNEIKTDNTIDNLEWCTYAYNNTYGEASKRRSDSLKGKPTWNKGRRMTDEFRKKVSDGMKKYYHNHVNGG
jgi:hypothetical protein